MPERRGFGFTTEPLLCVHPQLEPIVGTARTAAHPSGRSRRAEREMELACYRYMGEPPHPTVTVVEALDLVHADRHGAVVVPRSAVAELPAAAP